jgi:alanyl-tRNA synthetase
MFLELRKKFFEFWKERGHALVPSSSLVPDDPSVLLTTAGMQQFKRYYTGELNAQTDFGSSRTTSIQKCFRTSDIEEVGDDTHLTFFEMLGNFSFGPVKNDDPKDTRGNGGYFKKAAIVWAYEFLTNVLEITPERIHVTIFKGDKDSNIPKDSESYAIWYKEIGLAEDKIKEGGREDNFWGPTGAEGPCGPTTEIYVDNVEVWNIVFNEFYKTRIDTNKDSTLINTDIGINPSNQYKSVFRRLENPGIDTGMGFERLLVMLEGVKNVFETGAFHPIISKIRELAPNLSERDTRLLADHIRSSSFLIADGIRPSNKEAGYILRRLMRRIIATSIKNDIHADIFAEVYGEVKELFGEIYLEVKNEKEILDVWNEEKNKFEGAIAKGIKEIEKYETISGSQAFYIYETFGLPFELTKELAPAPAVKGLSYQDYEVEFKKHQAISRAGAEKKFGGHGLVLDTGELKAGNEQELSRVLRMHTATHLLQWAMRKVLGDNIHQMGSDINPERLRFDFNFDRKLTPEEISEIEKLVNEGVVKDLPVYFKEMPKKEAEKVGALAFFKEKYPETVKVYFIGSDEGGGVISKEFCGGPHVDSTGIIGKVKIIKEESVGKGVRRIRATVE